VRFLARFVLKEFKRFLFFSRFANSKILLIKNNTNKKKKTKNKNKTNKTKNTTKNGVGE
jgi:DNA polymerase III delta subunit